MMAESGPEKSCEDKSLKAAVPDADQELDCLLDSALADFEKKPDATKSESSPAQKSASDEVDTGADGWSDEFMQQAASEFENAMRSLLSEDPALADEFKKLASAAVADTTSTNTASGDLSDSISQTLKGLAENAEALTNPLNEEELSQLLGNIGINQGQHGEEGLPDLMPFMKNVMQSLLSKELLYPSLKDVTDKYPEWLAENRTKLTPDKYSKYNQQYELMKQACDEYETEHVDDTPSVKKERFEKILDLMQKMQDCGQPPKELVADIAPGQEQAANALFSGATSGESCSIM